MHAEKTPLESSTQNTRDTASPSPSGSGPEFGAATRRQSSLLVMHFITSRPSRRVKLHTVPDHTHRARSEGLAEDLHNLSDALIAALETADLVELGAIEAVSEVPARHCDGVRDMRAVPGLEDAGSLARRAKGMAVDDDLFLDLGLAHAALKPNQILHLRVGLAFRAHAQVAARQGSKSGHVILAEEALPGQGRLKVSHELESESNSSRAHLQHAAAQMRTPPALT